MGAWWRYDYSQGLKQLREEKLPTISKQSFSETLLLTTGEDFIDRLLNDVLKAKKHVHIQFYIFRSDQTGKRVIDSLCKKAQEGVEVRLLVDRFGCKLTHSLKKKLYTAGAEFYCSANIRSPYFFFSLNRRNHRKLAIIDGKISYIGGFNVGDEYLGRDPFLVFGVISTSELLGKAVPMYSINFYKISKQLLARNYPIATPFSLS